VTSFTMQDLLAQAKESGVETGGQLPEGVQVVTVLKANHRKPTAERPSGQLGVYLKNQDGDVGWINQNYGPNNPKGAGFLLRMLKGFGVGEAYIAEAGLDVVAEQLTGRSVRVKVVLTPSKKENGAPFVNGYDWTPVDEAPAAAAAPVPPAVPAPAPAPAAAPAPAPQPAAAPVPTTADGLPEPF
jgi:hypothetical protein